jgi:hypothetical protein
MKSLQDALYNWLTIKVVTDALPHDRSAQETAQLFEMILLEEHQLEVENISIIKDERMYQLQFEKDGKEKVYRYPIDLIEAMLNHIKAEPEKFKSYPLD